jgi:hypothetical protein
MNKSYLLIIIQIIVTSFSCSGQSNIVSTEKVPDLNFISRNSVKELQNKESVQLIQGCLVYYTNKGEQELERILKLPTSLTKNEIRTLLLSILSNEKLYHLHSLASSQFQKHKLYEFCKKEILKSNKSNYIRFQSIHSVEKVFSSGGRFRDLSKTEQDKLLEEISNNTGDVQFQKYLLEALYSLTSKKENGRRIYKAINKIRKSGPIKLYNDSLYKTFVELKPNYVKINAIHTWMEMDKNEDKLEKLFIKSHPMMFLQILSENPSTVLDSEKLSNLKLDALKHIIDSSKPNSFYNIYRLTLLNELLIDQNYSVRFLETILTKKQKNKLIKKLER